MPLAQEDDPYITMNGSIIDQAGLTPEQRRNNNNKRKVLPDFASMTVVKSLSIEKLPEPDLRQQTVISATVGLKLLGLTETDIAEVLGTPFDNVMRIINSPAAQATFERTYQNIIHAGADAVQGRIASHAKKAVDVVVEMMEDSEVRDDVRLKAAQDVLDRSGTNADQYFSESIRDQNADDELRIVIMDESGVNEKVKIDIKKG